MGSKGPRKMTVLLGGLDHDGDLRDYPSDLVKQCNGNLDEADILKLFNKAPQWNEGTRILPLFSMSF